ncbi:MAG: FkbM family methyltransferase [Ferruginibacter sp.]
MRSSLKKILDKFLHPLGLNIERFFGNDLTLRKLVEISKQQKIDLLLDVGANTGQFAQKMIAMGFDGKIISFEPLSSAYVLLGKNASHHPAWSVSERAAIGNEDGTIMINIAGNNHSSSILTVNKVHVDAAPAAGIIGKEEVLIQKLDTIAAKFCDANGILLKIDTQGFEKNVLLGAEKLIREKVKIIQLEISLLPLYEGAPAFEEMINLLDHMGFKPLFYGPGYIDRNTDQIQQIEGFFIKK